MKILVVRRDNIGDLVLTTPVFRALRARHPGARIEALVNSYNAKNVFLYVFDYTKSPPTRQAISQFPLLPSAGVTIQF